MHILHLIKTSEGAGWAINLMKEIKDRYPEISFSVILPSGGRHIDKYYDVCRDVYLFNYKLNFSIVKRGIELRKLVLRDKPDIIHSWFTQTTLYARLFLRNVNVPRVFQVVGPAHLEKKLFKYGDIVSAQKNDFWLATSEYILDKYKKSGVSDEKIFFNYAYTDIKALLKTKDYVAKRDLRKEFNIKENIKIIGTASYIYPPNFYEKHGLKGHEQLIEVFSEILQVRDDVVLVIAGATFGNNTRYEKLLKKKAAKVSKTKIIFTGKYSQVYSIISNFDVFVYLSKTENLGGVFESLLFEIPTISSDRGGLPELVINNETGYNISLKNNFLIKEKILDMMSSDNEVFKKNGKKRVLDLSNQDVIINKSFEIYRKILKLK